MVKKTTNRVSLQVSDEIKSYLYLKLEDLLSMSTQLKDKLSHLIENIEKSGLYFDPNQYDEEFLRLINKIEENFNEINRIHSILKKEN